METPTKILSWSVENFGELTALRIATRASKEVNEFMSAVLCGAAPEAIHEELADCAVMLWQVAELLDRADYRPSQVTRRMASDLFLCDGEAPSYVQRLSVLLQKHVTSLLDELLSLEYAEGAMGIGRFHGNANAILGDVLTIVETLAFVLDINLQAYVDNKMKVNRARTWKKLNDGSFQHVETPCHSAA